MKEIPKDVSKAFSDFCKMHDWTEQEVLTHLMLYAIKQGVDLAPKLHTQRSRLRKNPKWLKEQLDSFYLY
jgi:hypothetical protein